MDTKTVPLLEDIKKLLVLSLISNGVQAKDIANVLNVNKSTITRIVAARKLKKA